MAYRIIGETIKSATSIKLGEIFGNDTIRYKESVTNVKYPNFFISQLNLNITPSGTKFNDRIRLDYLMNIRYRVAKDTENITNLQQQLDNIGLQLCTQLLELDLEKPVKTKNRSYEKDDGVLQFTFSVTVFAIPEKEDIEKLKNYKLNEEVI